MGAAHAGGRGLARGEEEEMRRKPKRSMTKENVKRRRKRIAARRRFKEARQLLDFFGASNGRY